MQSTEHLPASRSVLGRFAPGTDRATGRCSVTADVRHKHTPPMSLGFPAYYNQDIYHALDLEQAKGRARRAADAQGWRLLKETDEYIVYQVGINLLSWGEEVKMSFSPGKVHLHSKCRWFLQCLDWGKNRQNCQQLAMIYVI